MKSSYETSWRELVYIHTHTHIHMSTRRVREVNEAEILGSNVALILLASRGLSSPMCTCVRVYLSPLCNSSSSSSSRSSGCSM
ncbi:unnamed protein product [Trichogramma brassicae]|uniref:Uncharacterized protein n=1 Tax=Trichogramma brassicae TaxID=86971 RepID=A0A6H5IU83_9HYME|nr:unnamed protein product [Trichogramma brassicae]